MTKVSCKTNNEIGEIIGKIQNCGVKIYYQSTFEHKNCKFVKGDLEDLLTIEKQIKINFPHCQTKLVPNNYILWWNEFNKNERVLEIYIPDMDSKEIIETCFNRR